MDYDDGRGTKETGNNITMVSVILNYQTGCEIKADCGLQNSAGPLI